MSLDELVIELNAFYNLGKERRECNALIQCFGIKNAEIIREIGVMPEEIIDKSILKGTKYATEIRKGIKLAKYVVLKDEIIS
jgi:hypothetical protein